MNKRNRMVQKTTEQIVGQQYRNGGWIEEILKMSREDIRKPHEKVIDTTFEKMPAFYDGFKKLVTDNPLEECLKGMEHLHRHEYIQAHVCYLKAARIGYAEGYYRIGNLYMFGRGVEKDYNMAECMFRTAREKGFVPQAEEALEMLKRFRKKEEFRYGDDVDV